MPNREPKDEMSKLVEQMRPEPGVSLPVPEVPPAIVPVARESCPHPGELAEVVPAVAPDTRTGWVSRCKQCGAQSEVPAP